MVKNIQFYFSIRRSTGYNVKELELRNKIKAFLKKRDYDHAIEMESKEFNQIQACLSDILAVWITWVFLCKGKIQYINVLWSVEKLSKKNYISGVDELKEAIYQTFYHSKK